MTAPPKTPIYNEEERRPMEIFLPVGVGLFGLSIIFTLFAIRQELCAIREKLTEYVDAEYCECEENDAS